MSDPFITFEFLLNFLMTNTHCYLSPDNTNKDFLFSNPNAFNTVTKFFVFGVSKSKFSITTKLLSFACVLRADLRAKRFKFLLSLKE